VNQDIVVTIPTGSIPLDMEFLPTGLFVEEFSWALERNQDSSLTLNFSDGLPKPRTLSVEATKRFTTAQDREDYLRELRELIGQAQGLVYAGEIAFPVESAWVNVGFSPSRVLDVDITINFAFPVVTFSSYWLDGVHLFRDDILMSRSDITMETLRSA